MGQLIGVVVAFAVLFAVLAAASRLLAVEKGKKGGGGTEGDVPLPYRKQGSLLSPAERSFYEVLVRAVAGEGVGGVGRPAVVFAKVRLADLVMVPRGGGARGGEKGWQGHQNRVNMKHVDFVVCAAETMEPLAAVELDDASHGQGARVRRDDFVNRALGAAGLPLVRVRASTGYSVAELGRAVRGAVFGAEGTAQRGAGGGVGGPASGAGR